MRCLRSGGSTGGICKTADYADFNGLNGFITTLTMEQGPFIPLISDYGFKATFGNETNDLFLRTALQALIKSPVPIREV